MSAITTHVLDTSRGRPAEGVPVLLEIQSMSADWEVIGKGATDADGRLKDLLSPDYTLRSGVYRLTFDTRSYYSSLNSQSFYPEVSIIFEVMDASQHYHVPLLLSPYGYTTYRGS
jgi:5-hydroxyisourate hydrolase